MAKITTLIFMLGLSMAVHSTANAPQPDYLAVLKKGTEVQLKETIAGYKIIVFDGGGTHKVINVEPDYVAVIDLTGNITIRINKTAVLSITEIKGK
jgi:hypothetical protein